MSAAYIDYLDAFIENPDIPGHTGGMVVGAYLVRILAEVWAKEESFSGKRPFGNSGWKHNVYDALIAAGLANEGEEDHMDQMIATAIDRIWIYAVRGAQAMG
jgi:hypothetical protein